MIGRKWWVPWLWLSPALLLLGVFLVYPSLYTIAQSLKSDDASWGDFFTKPGAWTLGNYKFIINNPQSFVADTHSAILNNVLWLVLFTGLTVSLGLLFAVLAARVRYEAVAKSAIFVPMAISMVAASVIWKFMYEYSPDIGTVNAVVGQAGHGPTGWLVDQHSPWSWFGIGSEGDLGPLQVNNFSLILIGVWMWTGFAMVVLSAGLKSISTDLIEAARVDGATECQIFRRITLPIMSPTITVVATTIVILALKMFDLVWVTTGGRFDTDLVATLFFKESFVFRSYGIGAALAVVLLVAVAADHGHRNPPVPVPGGDALMSAATTPRTMPVTATQRKSLTFRLVRFGGRVPLHISLIGLIILWSIPTLALLISSFRPKNLISSSGWWNALTHPTHWTLDNYHAVISSQGMGHAFVNSIIITVPATLLVILIAAFAAYAFAWMRFPMRNTLFLVFVALLVVPLQMTLIPVLRLYANLRVDTEVPIIGGRLFGTGSYISLWLAHAAYGLPFAIYLLRNFFGSLPRDLFESAYLDGASDFHVFRRIVLPLSMPAIAALAIFQFLWVWNDLLVSLVLLQDPNLAPMTLRITNLVSSFGSNYEVLTAAAFVSMALPLVVFFALQRYFVQGVLAGAVKG